MEKFDINKAGFCPVGDSESVRDFNQAYTDYCIEKHNADKNAHIAEN